MRTSTNTIKIPSTLPSGIGVSRRMTQLKDSELLLAVRTNRDARAFSEFYSRHLKSGFNVAKYISRSHEQAEEAVQEAMFLMWQSSDKVIEGKERAWFLRLVANISLRAGRDKSRKARHVKSIAREKYEEEATATGHSMEHKELLNAIRSSIDELPKEERHLISMYFVAGLSQAEMSEALKMSQATISLRLKKVIQQLKSKMMRVGLASAAVLDWNALLDDAISAHETLAPAIQQRLIQATEKQCNALSNSKSKHSKTPVRALASLIGLLILGAVVVGLQHKGAEQIVSVDPVKATSAPVAISGSVYDDHFKSKTLDPFWKIVRPKAHVRSAQGIEKSNLEIVAINHSGITASPQEVMTEMISTEVVLDNKRDMLFKFYASPPEGFGTIEYGLEIKNDLGEQIIKQGYKVTKGKDGRYLISDFLYLYGQPSETGYGKKYDTIMEPFAVSGTLNAKSALKIKPSKNEKVPVRWELDGVNRKLSSLVTRSLGHITFRIYVIAAPNSEIRWSIDRILIKNFYGGVEVPGDPQKNKPADSTDAK